MKIYIAHNNHGVILGAFSTMDKAVERLKREAEELANDETEHISEVHWYKGHAFSFYDELLDDNFIYTITECELDKTTIH